MSTDNNAPMPGFDPEFESLTDYILKITHRIWEQRGVDKIRDWYAERAPVYTPTSVTDQVEDVVKSTLQTLHMFPDRQLYGEDVIGAEPKPGLYYSSHRILSTMTHKGDGYFGNPTGRAVKTRIIADCVCRNNQVVEEWMVRDQAAIVRDVGLDPKTFGRAQGLALRQVGGAPSADDYRERWRGGPEAPSLGDSRYAKTLAAGLKAVWTNAATREIYQHYDRGAEAHVPGGVTLNGVDEIERWHAGWKASFPQAEFELQHWIERADPGEPARVALRWSVSGEHSGFGHFGAPSGADVTLMAISHFELRGGRILRAWHLLDELSVWTQIAAGE